MKQSIYIILLALSLIPAVALAQGEPVNDELPETHGNDDSTAEASDDPNDVNSESYEMAVQQQKPDHNIRIAIFPRDKVIQVKLVTSEGDITCDLYAGLHPLTVMNFIALGDGNPG